MQLVDDDHAERAEQSWGVAMGQHQRDLLWRGEQDVGRREPLALAARGRRVTGARFKRDGQSHLRHGLRQVAGNVDGKGLQGRDVEGADAAALLLGALLGQIDEAGQEPGKGLAAAGRRDEQRVALLPCKPQELKLMGVGTPAARGEPAGKGLRQRGASPFLKLLFSRPIISSCLTLPFSFTNSGHKVSRIAILRCV